MAKDPAFLFYPGDYIAGTMHLDFECKGAYMELLMLQFNRGHMTKHMIGQVLGQRHAQIWGQIEDKFQTDGETYWNERLKEEKEKRQKYSESRKNNKKGVNQYTKKRGHTTSHMEDENENENISVITNVKKKKPKKTKHSFEDSPIFDKNKFKARFPTWDSELLNHYYNSALEYSGSKGMKYLDWGLAISGWQRRRGVDQKTNQVNRPKPFAEQEEETATNYMDKLNLTGRELNNERMGNAETELIQGGDNENVLGIQ